LALPLWRWNLSAWLKPGTAEFATTENKMAEDAPPTPNQRSAKYAGVLLMAVEITPPEASPGMLR